VKNQRVIVVDDSIVRGTTCKTRVNNLKQAGAKEVHVFVSCPPHMNPCVYGIDFPDRSDKMGAAEKNDRSSTGTSEGTEGKGGPKGSVANISVEQKTRVKSVFSSHRVAPARNIGVAVNVGVVIPRSVHVYAVPEEIVTIVPDYRGYRYFMIDDDRVAIVDPDTFEIVDIIVVA
jgi:hypothetical protein